MGFLRFEKENLRGKKSWVCREKHDAHRKEKFVGKTSGGSEFRTDRKGKKEKESPKPDLFRESWKILVRGLKWNKLLEKEET